ncbi:putative integral membrane protein [Phaeomoniella chlamydospora]|uniref:Putative integral membrane protein n=1 Tax=Phaeomoniella chlamydospora TaxID=158046 RepID=A0A0G2F1D7_PHACM|nr:putative integral membrane protein [Phaeomoniella chlamydospora]
MASTRSLYKNTADDRSGIIIVITYVMLSVSTFLLLLQAGVGIYLKHPKGVNDILLHLAGVFSIAQSIAITLSATNGLGRHRHDLSNGQFNRFSKFYYAGQICQIVAVGLSKLSVIIIINRLSSNRKVILACRCFAVVIIIYILFSTLTTAFQCRFPFWTFAPNRCVLRGNLLYAISDSNALLDIVLIILPIVAIIQYKPRLPQRGFLIASFITRAAPLAAAILSLVSLPTYLHNTKDTTWTILPISTINEILVHLNIIVACIPSILLISLNPPLPSNRETASNNPIHRHRPPPFQKLPSHTNTTIRPSTPLFRYAHNFSPIQSFFHISGGREACDNNNNRRSDRRGPNNNNNTSKYTGGGGVAGRRRRGDEDNNNNTTRSPTKRKSMADSLRTLTSFKGVRKTMEVRVEIEERGVSRRGGGIGG